MKSKYEVDCGRMVISGGAGRGSYLSDRIPLFDENIARRFSGNEIYLDMQRASKLLERKSSILIRYMMGFSAVLGIAYTAVVAQASGGAQGVDDIAGRAAAAVLMALIFFMVMLLASAWHTKENIGGRRINMLIKDCDVKSSLRAYYEEFIAEALPEFSNSTTQLQPIIRDFKIDAMAEADSKVGSRDIVISGRCYSKDSFKDVEVTVRFNPIYYNLKVVSYTIG